LVDSPKTAWYVYFFDGNTHSGGMDSTYRVRCVRSPATVTPAERYTISGGTVLDTLTKLTWQRSLDAATRSWSEAGAYCASLTLDGAGWRLPNMKELQTLIDERTTSPAIDRAAFPDTPSEAFWTSSPLVGGPVEAWFVNFYSGVSYTNVPENAYRVRCVR
jgi:WD40 repeat protein